MADYQETYKKYQIALKYRELMADENFQLLEKEMERLVLESINTTKGQEQMCFMSGALAPFKITKREADKVDKYRDELDKIINEEK